MANENGHSKGAARDIAKMGVITDLIIVNGQEKWVYAEGMVNEIMCG